MAETHDIDSNGAAIDGANENHGWQKVTNMKKQRRQAAKLAAAGGAQQEELVGDSGGSKVGSSDSKVVQVLESAAKKRRARRKAKKEAATAAVGAAGEDDSDGEDGERRVKVNGSKDAVDTKNPKAKKVKKAKKPKVSVQEAATAIDVVDLATFLSGTSESFETLDRQLTRCADYFARAFNLVTNEKLPWNKILLESPVAKSIEIPYSYLPEPLVQIASDWLSQKPIDALSKFTLWLLNELLDEAQQKKGPASSPANPKVGLLVLLALLLRKKPEVLVQEAATVQAQFQGLDKVHTLVWAYGQAAQGDLVAGMALWVQNLLPLAVGKASNPASRDLTLQFVESVLFANPNKACPVLLNGATRKGERLVPLTSFEVLLRETFPSESEKTKATGRFQAVYPLIKELAIEGASRSKATRSLAQQLLPLSLTLAAEDVKALQEEAISCFVWSLAQNSDCYKQWENLHLENLKASTKILSLIRGDWKQNLTQLTPLDDFKRTLQALSMKHQNALTVAEGDDELEWELKAAESVTKSLLRKTTRLPVFAAPVVTLAIAAASGGFYLLSPEVNPWGWDGYLLLSKIHSFLGL